ncbi:START domain-containing protein [Entamoeba marina]
MKSTQSLVVDSTDKVEVVDKVVDKENKIHLSNDIVDSESLHEKQFDSIETQSYETNELTENEINTERIHYINALNSQRNETYLPYITSFDYACVLEMEKVNDPEYHHSLLSGVDVWRKKVDKSTWSGITRLTIKKYFTKRNVRTWDTFYTVLNDLEVLPNGDIISRSAAWLPKPFKQRDFVHIRGVIKTDDCCIGVYLPAEHVLAPVGMDGFVRGLAIFSGFVFRKQGNDCLCTAMTQSDIHFPLPDLIVIKFVSITVRWYTKLMRKAAETYKKKLIN